MWLGEGITDTKQSTYFLAENSQICHFQTIPLPLETRKNPGCFIIFIWVFIWKILKNGVKCGTTWELTWKQQKHTCPRQFSWNFFLNFGLQLMCTSLACQYSKPASQTLFWWKAAAFINMTSVTTQAAKDKPKGNAVCWNKFWF